MRVIDLETVTEKVKALLIKINHELDDSLVNAFKRAKEKETGDLSRSILDDIIENQELAKRGDTPLCQDTGMVVVFADIGKDLSYEGVLDDAINEGVRKAYTEGYLRKSVVTHPFDRVNSKDNTPAIIHHRIVEGDRLKLRIASKGAGSENMSRVIMLKPSDGIEGVKKTILDTVFDAGGKPCPPIIVGIGIGGNLEKSAMIAKEAVLRDLDDHSPDPAIRKLEEELYEEINRLGVGPMGVGGATTCLAVKINTFPMHIASLPLAINIQCHSSRHEEVVL
ncbi:MAG: fumarate hydratase [Candidatus Izemoplasmataceae bacterium]